MPICDPLVVGLGLPFGGAREASAVGLGSACLLLASLRALGIVTVLGDRMHQRDWLFALAAAFVVVLIPYGVVIHL